MSDIFVSYSSKDRRWVERLVATLEKHQPGWSIWWDREIGPGRRIDAEIRRELGTARCVVVVWSRAALESDWVLSEAEQGRMRSVLIPVKIDAVDPPMPFERIKSASLVNWSGELSHPGFQELLESIAVRLEQPPPEPVVERGWWARFRRLRLATRYAIAAVLGLVLVAGGISAYRILHDAAPTGMVLIPGGKFTMGSTAEEVRDAYASALKAHPTLSPTWMEPMRPDHEVALDAFYIDRHEVTEADFHRFAKAANLGTPQSAPAKNPDYPVIGVTWQEADAYCRHHGKVLPSEAQWEMAARGGGKRRYPWGDDPPGGTRANFCDQNCAKEWRDKSQDDRHSERAPVGAYAAGRSAHGVYDLAGNVAEWVRDWYDRDFYTRPAGANPFNGSAAGSPAMRAVRGGDWSSDASELRAAYRYAATPETRRDTIGFRCAKEIRD